MLYAWPDIRRMGLGNKLLVWARAEAFAFDTGARVLKPDFVQFPSIGALLRGESSLRTNLGNFDFSKSTYISGRNKRYLSKHGKIIDEMDWRPGLQDGVIRFHGIGNDSFGAVLEHHAYICERLRSITNRDILKRVDKMAMEPFIGVHIRRGDFKQAGVLVPDEWYVTAIRLAMELRPDLNDIRVFSDGKRGELSFLRGIDLPGSKRLCIHPASKPLQDIWCLSRSSIMVGSSRSSFSIWAVLLGQMPSIWAKRNAPDAKDLYLSGGVDPVVI